jgi:hypothetical protein
MVGEYLHGGLRVRVVGGLNHTVSNGISKGTITLESLVFETICSYGHAMGVQAVILAD